ncbi:MAG: SRPBCC family protein [Deltaproteobacteria bacterium]|nr:SRPBCC family protein [Deltaproteobacteria bacterium]NND28537.1 SRPBCC family protein [Myxococcales bacterium]MBT8464765.1 SRPBCC family protein [Deltaproteobacteria bacterium]MBT8482659.1 SRPBCC family protein [Deltaproteobacteria bacterium]NNK06704.1 SRPBCC family protein [Myxococcales bacterium]
MASWKDSILIHASPEDVFAYVDDPTELPTWLPGMIEVRNVEGTGLGQQYEYTYKMGGLQFRGQNVVIEYVPNERGLHHVLGMISALWEYSVEPHANGTVLNIEVEYTIPIPVLGRIAERLAIKQNAASFELALINVKDVLEHEG